MKKLMLGVTLGAAFAANGLTPALAFGPSPSDAHPPGALFQSTPRGAAKSDPFNNMANPPIDLRQRPSVDEMRSSNVRLNTTPRLHRGTRHRSTAPMR